MPADTTYTSPRCSELPNPSLTALIIGAAAQLRAEHQNRENVPTNNTRGSWPADPRSTYGRYPPATI
jgi:hypothetical protein